MSCSHILKHKRNKVAVEQKEINLYIKQAFADL